MFTPVIVILFYHISGLKICRICSYDVDYQHVEEYLLLESFSSYCKPFSLSVNSSCSLSISLCCCFPHYRSYPNFLYSFPSVNCLPQNWECSIPPSQPRPFASYSVLPLPELIKNWPRDHSLCHCDLWPLDVICPPSGAPLLAGHTPSECLTISPPLASGGEFMLSH